VTAGLSAEFDARQWEEGWSVILKDNPSQMEYRRLLPLSDLAGIIGAAENLNDQDICTSALPKIPHLFFGVLSRG
jgi:hypothetical protein